MTVEKTFQTGEVSLNYAEGLDTGKPLVLLHGFANRWQGFKPIMPQLSGGWHLYAPDIRGRGRSARNPPHYRLRDLVDDTVEFLQGVVEEPCVLFGHSLGGLIAIWCAAAHPENVLAVVLGDAPLDIPKLIVEKDDEAASMRYQGYRALCGLPVEELMKRLGEIFPGQGDETRRNMAEDLNMCDPGTLMYHAEGRQDEFYEGFRIDELLQGIVVPVLFLRVRPELGGMNSDGIVEHILGLNERIRYVLVEGVDHELGLDVGNVEPLLTALTPFLEDLN